MSEKIYSLLFRLFPPRFRERWHDDALELFRERAGHERGFRARMRLWFGLLSDLAVSLPRVYLREEAGLQEEAALVPAANAPRQAVPSFMMLEDKPIRSSAYFYGTLLSLILLMGISFMAKHSGHFPMRADADSGGITMDPWATGAAGDGGNGSLLVIGKGDDAAAAKPRAVRPARIVVQAAPPEQMPFFDAEEKHRVLLGVAEVLKQRYSDQAAAQRLGKSLLHAEGALGNTADPDAFAVAVTRRLRADSGDMHFEVAYLRDQPPGRTAAAVNDAAYRATMRDANCMMAPPAILPHNIGYLKLDWFAEPEVCGESLVSAMKTLSRADGLVIDLRENSGGSPEMVKFLAGWLFDRPAFLWNPRESSAANMWTHSPMAGSGLASKPVWVLTSPRTYSAAEQFAYNLKMLHRATLVGETTAGATDVGVFHRIDDHFGIGLRESRVTNPYSSTDWAVHGVEPDVHIPAVQALETAQRMAVSDLARR
jgi:Peptidase family S41